MNEGKARADSPVWAKWKASGAVKSVESAKQGGTQILESLVSAPSVISPEVIVPPHVIERTRPTKKTLDKDMDTYAEDRLFSVPFREIILDGKGSKDDIMKWYKSQDPVGEILMRATLEDPDESVTFMARFNNLMSVVYEKAAERYLGESGLTTSGFNLTPDVVLKLKDGRLSPDQFEDLIQAADMLSCSGRDAALVMDLVTAKRIKLPDDQEKELRSIIIRTDISMNSFLEQIYTGIKNNPAIIESRILKYGLRAFMMHMCNVGFDKSDPAAAHEYRKAFISVGIEYLDDFLLKRRLIDKLSSRDGRGKLLETLWAFDAYFYLTQQGRDFAQVVPALDNEDRPFADRGIPKKQYQNLRKMDVLLFDAENGISFGAQLGQEGKPNGSHGCIFTIRQNDFKDDSPAELEANLVARLAAYSDAVDSDFAEQESKEALRYVLSSIPDIYSRYNTTDYNMFREALGLEPDMQVVAGLSMLDQQGYPAVLPQVLYEHLERKRLKREAIQAYLDDLPDFFIDFEKDESE